MVRILTTLFRNVTGVWGAAGERWLADLPALLDGLAADWDLVLGAPYDLTFHYVAPVRQADGTPAVLKVGFELEVEAAALAAFDGGGAARLLRLDAPRGALLLEQVTPGHRLRDLVPADDPAATAVLADLMRQLHVPPPASHVPPPASHGLPPVLSQVDALDRHRGPVPADLVTQAAALMRSLCATASREVVLHGDLHHDNVLAGSRAPWLAIDPHGLVGDPGYEVGSILFNPFPDDRDPALTALVPARLRQLSSALGLAEDRLAAWGFVKAVLSSVWTADSGGPLNRALDVAHLLRPT
ncbi:aminoglycoside phosphotransferase family protein [Dactylosporangium sp. NPDC000521]|uniref:aminoglycoside phosphotransferase family protein n=1 Tax=Dactylosporangium sp. NPDC000521 TaxID=3363975 RepID=UPI00367445FB